MRSSRVAIIGAGIAGLVTALELASKGLEVDVIESAPGPGGKLRPVEIDSAQFDAGPTVFTMRWVFERLFGDLGLSLDDHLTLTPVEILARHAWSDTERFDLYADPKRSEDEVGRFSGAAEARRYREFCKRAGRVYETLESSFVEAPATGAPGLVGRVGARGLSGLLQGAPFSSLWQVLGEYFHDPRLRQLFGRYATYCGSSPFLAPAMLMIVAHVEQRGVWMVEGGMRRIAAVLADLAAARGVRFHYGRRAEEILMRDGRPSGVRLDDGERLAAESVVVNADAAALAAGLFGDKLRPAVPETRPDERSLSAMTWLFAAECEGFPLLRHNVFFSGDYRAEFDALKRSTMPEAPTVYLCAQDRRDAVTHGRERFLCLINAPASGDGKGFDRVEVEQCEKRTFGLLERCGLRLKRQSAATVTTPRDFNRLYPGTGGALYGRASHGWRASFQRPGSRTKITGIYLAGGSTHPGPGVPMAALSGRLAAASLLQDLASTGRSVQVAMPGGISTRSATTDAMV